MMYVRGSIANNVILYDVVKEHKVKPKLKPRYI